MYDQPESRFGGWFLGNPGMNFVAPSSRTAGTLRFDVLPQPLAYAAGTAGEVSLGIRPEHVEVLPQAEADTVPARVVRSSITIGGQNLLSLAVGETRLKAKTAPGQPPQDGATVFIRCRLENAVFFNDDVRLTGSGAPRRLTGDAVSWGSGRIYVVGTCDTKGAELAYVRQLIAAARACRSVLVDVSTRPHGG